MVIIALAKNVERRRKMTDDKITCVKCGRERRAVDYFLYKDGTYSDMCKDCLCMYIDNQKPDTFLWILEKFDVPYIEKLWINYYNKERLKNGTVGPRSVIGKYLRSMKMTQYREYHYSDTDKLNFKDQKNAQQAAITEEKMAELQEKLDKGEISQAEFDTYSASPEQITAMLTPQFIPDYSKENEEKIIEQLSDQDYQYLLFKWGELYRPSQWVRLEELYTKYENEYELNADREDALKKICKISLKMDEALDSGDIASMDKLQRTYDTLRKSAKFTEAQNKEGQARYLDSVGELVALCEKEGGPIPEFCDPDEYPQDKIDFTIKDLKSYTYNLAANELNLGDLIESYIKKLEEAEAKDEADLTAGLATSEEEERENMLTDEEAMEFQEYLEDEIERDAEMLLEAFGGDKDVS